MSDNLFEANRLALHLAPDRIGELAPAADFRRDAAVGELLGELLFDLGDQVDRTRRQPFEPFVDHPIGVGVELAERQVLELLAHLVHAHAPGERRIDVERLLRGAPPRVGRPVRQRAHIVQPVGELDQQHAHVVGDGEQELAQILGLLRLLGDEVEFFELGQALDQDADVVAEQASISARVASVSSMVSCNSAAAMVASSSLSSVRIAATCSGWEKYGSPESRICSPCARMA